MGQASGQLPRLVATCTAYHKRFGEWPTQLRLGAMHLQVLAQGLSEAEFRVLAGHFEIRTTASADDGPSVGGIGVVRYPDVADWGTRDELDAAWRWLGISDHE
jgi:hypothetical protein